MTSKNRIMIYGPKDDGTYVAEFRTADGDVLAISIQGPRRMSCGTSPSSDDLPIAVNSQPRRTFRKCRIVGFIT
jgi:hypothetical protein